MSDLNSQFQYFSGSVAKAGKDKCGDAFIVRELAEENLVVMMVADGVSTLPCDWLASKTACETAFAAFRELTGSLAGRMRAAAARANNAVRAVRDACRGMMTSLTFAVWEKGADEIHFLNVGDSRIYLGAENDLQPITVDDVAGLQITRGGKPLLVDGAPVFRRGVTRSLGQHEPLVFEVQTHRFSGGDLLVLVTDGICKNEAFTVKFEDIFSRGNFSEELEKLIKENSEKNKDDATLIVLWRAEKDEKSRLIYEECLKNNTNFRGNGLSGRKILEYMQEDLFEKLSQNSNTEVHRLLDYAAQFNLKFSRTFLVEFNSRVFKQNTDRPLWLRLQQLIRTA